MQFRRPLQGISVIILVSILAFGGCGESDLDSIPSAARRALEAPERLELFSLRPGDDETEPPNPFHDWEMLGSVNVTNAADRKRLSEALLKGAAENDGEVASCFEPRHALRVTRNRRTFDFVICFECLQVVVYEGDAELGYFLVSESPQPVFNEVLTAAGIELAPPAFSDSETVDSNESTEPSE
jgi:hypothetical protein